MVGRARLELRSGGGWKVEGSSMTTGMGRRRVGPFQRVEEGFMSCDRCKGNETGEV